jgi:serine/threonine protein kinase
MSERMTTVAAPPWVIEGYESVAELGHGEAGLVVRARHTATGADVAVRYLARRLSQAPGFLGRYRSEAASLRLIEAPNLAAHYGLVERGESAAVVTELVDGVSLRELLRQTGPFKPAAALYVAYSILLGLTEVHGRGLVHRALRPENVLVDGGGMVKVVDVGLARSDPLGLPANPFYAAPELWLGDQARPAADVFAATAILYECLTGQAPRGASGAYLGRSGLSPDGAIAALGPDVAGGPLGLYLTRGLATEPASRLIDARSGTDHLNAVAAAMFGSGWYEIGRTMLRRRLFRLSPVERPAARCATPPANGMASSTAWPPPQPDGWLPSASRPDQTQWSDVDTKPPPFTAPPDADRPSPSPRPDDRWDDEPPLVFSEDGPIPGSRSHRAVSSGRGRLVVIVGIVLALVSVAVFAVVRLDPRVDSTWTAPIVTDATAGTGVGTGNPDTTPPVAPLGLRVTGATSDRIALMWLDAHDDIGVAGYQVFRDGRMVAKVPRLGFTDTGLAPRMSYRYTVRAYDTSDNVSRDSITVTGSTLDTGSTPPAPTSDPSPVDGPRIESVSVTARRSGCTVAVQATIVASGAMTADMTYTVDNEWTAKVLVFTETDLTQTVSLGTFDDSDGGTAVARIADRFDLTSWAACAD